MAVGLTRVLVASSFPLVSDTVQAALVSRGFDTHVIRLEGSDAGSAAGSTAGAGVVTAGVRSFHADVGVLISDLSTVEQVRHARGFLAAADVRWLLLSAAPPGPAWGAALEAGAVAVLPGDATLEQVDHALQRLAAGEELMEEGERATWIDSWRRARGRREDLLRRLGTLTPRENDVMMLLYGGYRVHDIALRLDVTDATVRSHVKSTLHKLGASSQIDAVSLIAWLRATPQLGLPA